jgi:hypothetical protein
VRTIRPDPQRFYGTNEVTRTRHDTRASLNLLLLLSSRNHGVTPAWSTANARAEKGEGEHDDRMGRDARGVAIGSVSVFRDSIGWGPLKISTTVLNRNETTS